MPSSHSASLPFSVHNLRSFQRISCRRPSRESEWIPPFAIAGVAVVTTATTTTTAKSLLATFLLFQVLLLQQLPTTLVDGHAYNLVGTTAGCRKALSTKSTIMKQRVLSAEQSTHPNIRLKLARTAGEPHDMVLIDTDKTRLPITHWITLHNPYVNLPEIQYVVEVNSTSPSNVALFPEVGECDNQKRAAGPVNDHGWGVFFRIDTWPDDQGEFHVWAGWATGHEAVRLTPPLVFRRTTHDEEKEEF